METVKGPDRNHDELLISLVDQYQSSLLRLCFIYLHDKALAEDAVQETFLKAHRSLSSFRGDSSEKTWLTRIAMNTCRDMSEIMRCFIALAAYSWVRMPIRKH